MLAGGLTFWAAVMACSYSHPGSQNKFEESDSPRDWSIIHIAEVNETWI